jgi:hypothetical protein
MEWWANDDVSEALAFRAVKDWRGWRVALEPWCLSGGLHNVMFLEALLFILL